MNFYENDTNWMNNNTEQFYWKKHLHKLFGWVNPSHPEALQLRLTHREKIREIEKWIAIYGVELERIKENQQFLE